MTFGWNKEIKKVSRKKNIKIHKNFFLYFISWQLCVEIFIILKMALDSPATGARMKDLLKYFLVLSIVRVGTCSRLNVPRVLLPFSDLPPKFSLSGTFLSIIIYSIQCTVSDPYHFDADPLPG